MSTTRYLKSDFAPETPLRKIANARQQNLIASFIDEIEGIGCRVTKQLIGDRIKCLIVVDGGSDIMPDDTVGFLASAPGRTFAVDATDPAAYGKEQFSGYTTNAADSWDMSVGFDLVADSDDKTIRFYIPVATSGTPAHVLGRTSTGALCWVTTTDTCG